MGYFKESIRRSRCREEIRNRLASTALLDAKSIDASRAGREIYLRFSAGPVDPDLNHPTGIFRIDSGFTHGLTEHQSDLLNESYAWFNKNLVVPALTEPRAIFWFRATGASACVERIWDQVSLLRDSGIVIRVLRCKDPGLIIYRDEQQIAAIPQRRANWRYRSL